MLSSETNEKYGCLFAKAMAKNTAIVEENGNQNGVELGVYVDVFPIDGLGDTYEAALKEFKSTRFRRELLVARNWRKFFRSKTHSWKYEPIRFAFFLASRFASSKKLISKLQTRFRKKNYDECKYVATICGSYREREIAEKALYEEYEKIKFEDTEFFGLKKYDEYLSNIYGDYMKLPPEEKRISHHTFKAYITEE